MKTKHLFLCMLSCIFLFASCKNDNSNDLNNISYSTISVTAGGLSSALPDTVKKTITSLTIKGTIDARDFVTMRDCMPNLKTLDLTDVKVNSFAGMIAHNHYWNPIYENCPANTIPECAFYYLDSCKIKSNLTSIKLPSSVTTIGLLAFSGCPKLMSFDISSSVTTVGQGAFSDCESLTSIKLPSSVTSIGDLAFSGCHKLASFNIPPSVTTIGWGTFRYCESLTSFTIPSSVLSIGEEAFFCSSGLTSIIIPSSVTLIGDDAFNCCTGLTSITIPSSVTFIGNNALRNCTNLNSISVQRSTPVNLNSSINVFGAVNKTSCILYVPTGSKSAYKSANQWRDFTNIVEKAY